MRIVSKFITVEPPGTPGGGCAPQEIGYSISSEHEHGERQARGEALGGPISLALTNKATKNEIPVSTPAQYFILPCLKPKILHSPDLGRKLIYQEFSLLFTFSGSKQRQEFCLLLARTNKIIQYMESLHALFYEESRAEK